MRSRYIDKPTEQRWVREYSPDEFGLEGWSLNVRDLQRILADVSRNHWRFFRSVTNALDDIVESMLPSRPANASVCIQGQIGSPCKQAKIDHDIAPDQLRRCSE